MAKSVIQNIQKQQPYSQSHQILKYFQTKIDCLGRQNFGLILMVIAQTILPLSLVYPSESKINPIQTNLMRAIVTMVSHFWLISYFGLSFSLKSYENFKITFKRNIIICIHQFVLTGAPFFLPFSIVFTLNSSSVLFVFVLDYYLFDIQINKQQKMGVILGFLGVLLTVNGQFIVDLLYPDFQKQTEFKNYLTDDPYIKLLVAVLLIAMNFARAYALCISKLLKKVTGIQLSFYFGLLMLFQCAFLYPQIVTKPVEVSVVSWSVIYSAIPQNFAQILFMTAMVMSKNTGITNLICFVSIAVGYFISLVRYGQKLNIICLGGVLLILYGLIKTIVNRQAHQK